MTTSPTLPKVVVTGIGILHRLGEGIDPVWSNLIQGQSGIVKLDTFDTTDYTCKIGAILPPTYDPARYMDARDTKRSDSFAHYAMAASRMAVTHARLDTSKLDPWRFGVIISSGVGGLKTVQDQCFRLAEKGPKKISPFMIPSLIVNIAGGMVAIEFNARGPNFCPVSACASSTHAIGEAMHIIQRGDADIILAGGSEASIVPIGQSGFCSMKAMSSGFNDEPTRASRPFDAQRDGFVMGEGAAVLVLETEAHALARGATIYAEIAGYGATCDAHHITSPDPEGAGLAKCLEITLRKSGLSIYDIDYINAHGTSTPYNDKFETLAIKKVFGDHAYKVPISSTKSMTGHLLGAAGALEAAVCIKAIETGEIPPTINYEFPDPDCDLDYVPNKSRKVTVDAALSSNLGFGGHNAVLAVKRYTPSV